MSADRPTFHLHASVAIADDHRVLLVQESKPESAGQWNLPGGHLDHGETPPVGAARELREETGLELPLEGLVGIYPSRRAMRFVFRAALNGHSPRAGDEIRSVKLFTFEEAEALDDGQMVSATMLRAILRDVRAGKRYPNELFAD